MIIVLILFLLGVVSFGALVQQKYHNFNRFLAPGDPVRFYDCGEKLIGKVVSFFDEEDSGGNLIRMVIIEHEGEMITLSMQDILPVFYYHYTL